MRPWGVRHAPRSNTCDDSPDIPPGCLTRINDYEQIVIAAVDPQFSIVANSVLPNDLSTDRFLANVVKMVVPVQLPNGAEYGALVGLSRERPGADAGTCRIAGPAARQHARFARRSRGCTRREHPPHTSSDERSDRRADRQPQHARRGRRSSAATTSAATPTASRRGSS